MLVRSGADKSLRRWTIATVHWRLAWVGLLCDPQVPRERAVLAFEHVNVIPTDREQVLFDHTVIVRSEKFMAVGPAASLEVPAGAVRVSAPGAYLAPGLADMHAHPYDTDGLPSYLVHGVTTIGVMHGSPSVLDWRRRIRARALVGPTIYAAGPSVDGYPPANPLFVSVETEAQARAVIREQKRAGYDFIKIYSILNLREYDAILDEGKRQPIPVWGHIPWRVGMTRILAAGQSNVAHVEEFFTVGIQDAQFEEVVRLAQAGHTTVTASLFAYAHMLESIADLPSDLADSEMRYHSPAGLSEKLPATNRAIRRDPQSFVELLTGRQPRMRRFLKMLHDGGILVLAGTDTETFGFPGTSLLGELAELRKGGFTNYAIMQAATRNAGEAVAVGAPTSERFGTVSPGNRADLILLDSNPLEDLANLCKIRGVMTGGRWLPISEINHLRDSIAARNRDVHPFVGASTASS